MTTIPGRNSLNSLVMSTLWNHGFQAVDFKQKLENIITDADVYM